ncbi:hypothetical protein FEM48_Zijuj04G0009200 [Ziziphus jujuba var. spinosa]|uniref:Uncharacterized protein n=1 Tax=Ziziphus jujuba var. spinosa TaxID=714518 RepID=A0A978VGW9_ZIZJJ|nr:hypothetical protein FEM48_Zijuj04G0009200 [Ziziphus jujuba var. spinosa]
MPSATAFASALCLAQPVFYNWGNTSCLPQICLRFGSEPNSKPGSLMAKSLRLNTNHEFANGFPRFQKAPLNEIDIWAMEHKATAMVTKDGLEKIHFFMNAWQINFAEFTGCNHFWGPSWNAIANSIQVAKEKQRGSQIQIVETEHQMEGILRVSIDLARRYISVNGRREEMGSESIFDSTFGTYAEPFILSKVKAENVRAAFIPMKEAIDKFIQCHPPPIPNKVRSGLVYGFKTAASLKTKEEDNCEANVEETDKETNEDEDEEMDGDYYEIDTGWSNYLIQHSLHGLKESYQYWQVHEICLEHLWKQKAQQIHQNTCSSRMVDHTDTPDHMQ